MSRPCASLHGPPYEISFDFIPPNPAHPYLDSCPPGQAGGGEGCVTGRSHLPGKRNAVQGDSSKLPMARFTLRGCCKVAGCKVCRRRLRLRRGVRSIFLVHVASIRMACFFAFNGGSPGSLGGRVGGEVRRGGGGVEHSHALANRGLVRCRFQYFRIVRSVAGCQSSSSSSSASSPTSPPSSSSRSHSAPGV